MSRQPLALGALTLMLAASLGGCTGPVFPPKPVTSPPAGQPAGRTPSGAPVAGTPAVVDSSPSKEALGVLATIPEPLAESERVPPPAGATTTAGAAAGAAPSAAGTAASAAGLAAGAAAAGATSDGAAPRPDSSAADSAAADTVRESVPVPAPTVPLGAGTAIAALPESALVPRVPPPPPPPAEPDTCWRIQVAAPQNRAAAESKAKAATSQLLVPFAVERFGTRYKVRTRDCLESAAAVALKDRARRSGFNGAFVVPEKKKEEKKEVEKKGEKKP